MPHECHRRWVELNSEYLLPTSRCSTLGFFQCDIDSFLEQYLKYLTDPETCSGPNAVSGLDPEPAPNLEREVELGLAFEPEPDLEPEIGPALEANQEAGPKAEPGYELVQTSVSDPDPDLDSDQEFEPSPRPIVNPEPDLDLEPDSDPEPESDPELLTEPKPDMSGWDQAPNSDPKPVL